VPRVAPEKRREVGPCLSWLADLHQQSRTRQPGGIERRVEGQRTREIGARAARCVVRAMQLTAPQVECGVGWSGCDGAREGEDLVVEIAVSGGGTRP